MAALDPIPPAALRRTLSEHAPFLVVAGSYVVGGLILLRSRGLSLPNPVVEAYRWPLALTYVYLLTTFIGAVVALVFVGRRRPGDPGTWRHLWSGWLGSRRLIGTLLVLALLPALLTVMYGFRLGLTDFQPFFLDPALMKWDLWLHGGRHPWEWLQPVVGHPAATRVIDAVYVYGWFAALWLGTIWQTVHGREPIRSQFLLTFALAWILLGTFMAIATSSAGPVYFGRVTGLEDPYEPLMAYLAHVDAATPLRAIANQERLWATYTEWGGITAMPSLHVSIVTAVILAGVRSHRWLAIPLIPFGIVIIVGSVHLGWHYAVDSYVAVVATVLLWMGCGRFVRFWRSRHEQVRGP